MTKGDNKLMTQAEYARHRCCSREAVRKAVVGERITTFGPDKLVDADLADAQWLRNTRARASGRPVVTTDEAAGTMGSPEDADAADADAGTYNEYRRRRERAESALAELRLGETRGELIRLSAVKNALGVMFATARESFLQLPSRLAPQLSGETDPATIQNLLHAEIHQTLMELSGAGDRLGQPAAEGPG